VHGHVSHLVCLQCGQTPLHVATKQGQKDIVALLLDRGANVNATDERVSVLKVVQGHLHELVRVVCLVGGEVAVGQHIAGDHVGRNCASHGVHAFTQPAQMAAEVCW
jgi:hypothetical protein